MTGNVWFIAGASSGFGEAIAKEALARGDSVIASSRRSTALKHLEAAGAMIFDLDVTADDATLSAAIQKGVDKYGKITHFINAPGFATIGPAEGASAADALDSYNVNVLGIMNLTRHEIAYLRPRRSGFIANFGSVGSWQGGAGYSQYAAAKWAIAGYTESVHLEVKEFGINVISIEPGYFRTSFLNPGGSNVKQVSNPLEAEYQGTLVSQVRSALSAVDNHQPGDVTKAAKVINDILTGTGAAAGKEFPIRILLGQDCVNDVREKLASTEKLIREWEDVITSTDHDDVKKN